ncbi:UNVERIFIED_CONTAM: hypothetical protein HDU68_011460 [Siphonaria sp. JEL0065]|nr:hypothetical protein HDU68_011460 [Siphonaria sp. JEL0065]
MQKQPSFVDELAAQTIIETVSKERKRSVANPPLDLVFTTPKNMAGFIARIGPIVSLFEGIENLLNWKEPPKTTLALIVCCSLCLYPVVLTILPHGLILYLISSSYFEKAKYEHLMQTKLPGDLVNTPSSSISNIVPSPSTTATAVSATLPNYSSSTTPTPSATATAAMYSAAYLKNLQFIQNQMGLFVKGYDAIEFGLREFQVYADRNALVVVGCLIISSGVMLGIWCFVETRFLMLGGVLGVFFWETVLFQAILSTLPSAIYKNIVGRVDIVLEGIQAAKVAPGGSVVVVMLWENQRWWAGLGWISHLFRTERSPWSDETGNIARPTKDAYTLPLPSNGVGSWSWVDLEWTLDFEWATSGVDQREGWQYSDHRWENPRAKMGVGSITRRRVWVRRMRFVPNLGVTVVASLLPRPKTVDAADVDSSLKSRDTIGVTSSINSNMGKKDN